MQLKCGHHIINDECKTCTDLQKKWYKKLANSNFEDIEDYRFLGKPNYVVRKKALDPLSSADKTQVRSTILDCNRPLKEWHLNMLSNVTTTEVEITLDYYNKASELLHGHQFKNELQRKIWELHCQGLSRLKIEKALSRMPNSYKQSQIRNIIKDLERELEW